MNYDDIQMSLRTRAKNVSPQSLLEIIFYATMAALPFHGFFTIWFSSLVGLEFVLRSWPEVLMLVTGGILAVRLIRKDKLTLQVSNDPAVLLAVAYIVLILLYSAYFDSVQNGLTKANYLGLAIDTRFFIFFVLTYMVFVHTRNFKASERIMSAVIMVAAAVVSVGALLQAFVLPKDVLKHFGFVPPKFNPVLYIDGNGGFTRVRSFLRGPNELGAYLIAPIILILSLWRHTNNIRLRRVLAVCLAMASTALVLSYSRSAWVGLVAAVIIYYAGNIRSIIRRFIATSRGKVAAAVVVVVAVIGFGLFTRSDFYHIVILHDDKNNTVIGSTTARLNNFDTIKNDTFANPLGLGPGTSGPASVYGETRIPDNYYVQVAQQYGIFGLLLFLAVNGYVAWRLWQMRRYKWAWVGLAVLVGLSLSNMFLHNWADDTISLFYWGFAGWVFGTYKLSLKEKHQKTAQ